MAEKEVVQQKAAAQESEQQEGKGMMPPAFQLTADGGEGDGGGGGGGGIVQRKDPQAAQQDQGGPAYSTFTGKNAIVTIPKGSKGKDLPIVVIVGGLYYGTREWMMTQTPGGLFSKYILAFANYYNYFESGIKPDVDTALGKEGATGRYKAMLGFSKGGERIQAAKGDASWEFLGMIDPVVTDGATYPCPIYMVFTHWKSKDDPREKLHKRVQKGDVTGKSIDCGSVANHKNMPARWFTEFGDKL